MKKIAVYLLLSIFILPTLTQIETELFLENITPILTLDKQETKYYKLRIPNGIEAGEKYAVFNVFDADEEISDPDIFISAKKPFPTKTDNDWICSAVGDDSCVVPKVDVVSGKIFHISVYCYQKCKFKIKVSFNTEITIEEKSTHSDFVRAYECKFFVFQVKQEEDIQSISFSLSIGSHLIKKIRMYVVGSNDLRVVPSSNNNIQTIQSWIGWIASAYRTKDSLFCTNCLYKILLQELDSP